VVDPYIAQMILRFKPKRWSLLRNLPERAFFTRVKREKFRPGKGLVFGYIGVISRQRNVEAMLMAWREFVKRHPDCRMKIIGLVESYQAYFDSAIKPLLDELETSVEFQNDIPYEEVPAFYRSIDVSVVPNKGDHFPLKLGEAIAAGTPLILRHGPMREKLFNHKGIVWFHTPKDGKQTEWEILLEAFETAVNSYEKLSSDIQELKIPSWEDEVSRLIEVYQKLQK
jgi:glycosyltransferase involved in cell wall biosynthesis